MSVITIIAAVGENMELGRNNKLLWKLPADLEHFRKTTSGHPVIMGRKTFESIGKALPHRKNIVITSNNSFSAPDVQTASSLEAALQLIESQDEQIFVIGGAQIFSLAMPLADRLILTQVKATFPKADTFFPKFGNEWDIWEVQIVNKAKDNEYDFAIVEYYRNTQI